MIRLLTTLFIGWLALSACNKQADLINDFFHVQVDGAELPVLVKGNLNNGKLILFMNGGPGLTAIDVGLTDLALWEQNIENDYAIAYFDQRGTGNTLSPIDTNTLSIDQFSKDVAAIVKTLHYQYPNTKIYVMAHSFGGLSAADYLTSEYYDNNIAGFVCVNGHLVPKPVDNWQYRHKWLAYIANKELQLGNDTAKWRECLRWLASTPIIEEKADKDKWRDYVGDAETGIVKDANANIPFSKAMKVLFFSNYNLFPTYMSDNWLVVLKTIQKSYLHLNYIPKVKDITVPTLFYASEYDDLVPFQIAEDAVDTMKTNNRDTELFIMPNAGHEPFLSDPDMFAGKVKDWIGRH